MRSSLEIATVVVAALMAAAPAVALQTVTLPQAPGDATTNLPNPNNPSQDEFGTQQTDGQSSDFGAFHFHVTSGSDWPGDPYRHYQPQTSSPDAYGSAAAPGSEFSTSNLLYPH